MATLDVYCFGELAGRLVREDSQLSFAYESRWIGERRPPLSQALPIDGTHAADAPRAFFSGLLPEGEPRRMLARELGISERNDFALLEAVGGDCPGAISLYPAGTTPEAVRPGDDVEWLDEAELERLVYDLPSRPMLADAGGEIRLSLAGAQDKLPVVVDDASGRVGITSGRTPSTHILKTPISRLDGTIANEAYCLLLGRELGIPTVDAVPRHVGSTEFLLVRRYDREHLPNGVRRLHQEDFCQALGVPPERKYEAEDGPSLADCFSLVSRATSVPAQGTLALLDAVGLNFIVGNHDAHGKNFSLLYRPTSVQLAPFYDIVSTVAYRRHGLSRKMAMKLGGEYRSERVESRHFERFFSAAQLGSGPARRRLRRLATAAPDRARKVRSAMAEDGWRDDVLDRVIELVEDRSARLAGLVDG